MIRRGMRWPVGSRNLVWDREITQIDPTKNQVQVDAPITTALEAKYGGATIQKVLKDETIKNVGLENLILQSDYDKNNLVDEEHAWMAISINHAQDCWVGSVEARQFVSSAVYVGPRARQISVVDCICHGAVSEVGGFRRQSFWVEGQQVLVQNCQADSGINDFAIGLCAAGPNVFYNCKATNAFGASGSFESWASGVLYENVLIEGAGLNLAYDFDRAQAGGWTAVNSNHMELPGE